MFLMTGEMQTLHPKGTPISCVAISLATPILVNAQAPVFTQVIVFGDNLSDDGNIAHRARDLVGFTYPSINFNYSDYRFTDETNTSPEASQHNPTLWLVSVLM